MYMSTPTSSFFGAGRTAGFARAGDKWPGVDVEVTFPELARICLAENDRRLSIYDKRLKRPKFVPAMIRLALNQRNTFFCQI